MKIKSKKNVIKTKTKTPIKKVVKKKVPGPYKRTSKLITTLRKDSGLTQMQFMKKLKVSQGHLSMLENGNKELSLDTMKILVKNFKVEPKKVMFLEGRR